MRLRVSSGLRVGGNEKLPLSIPHLITSAAPWTFSCSRKFSISSARSSGIFGNAWRSRQLSAVLSDCQRSRSGATPLAAYSDFRFIRSNWISIR